MSRATAWTCAARSTITRCPAPYQVGPFAVTSTLLPHHVPNAGVRLTAAGRVLAYTGDTGPDPALAELGADADLFIVDATHQQGTPRFLLTARQAGQWAARARAGRPMLTHLWPGSDRAVSVTQAQAAFDGEILVADEDAVVQV